MATLEQIRTIIGIARRLRPKNLIWVQPRGYPVPAPYWPATNAQLAIVRAFPGLRVSRPAHAWLVDDHHKDEDAVDFIGDRADLFRAFMRAVRDPWGTWGFALGFDKADEHLHVDARAYGSGSCRVRLEVEKPDSGKRWRICPTDSDWDLKLRAAARQYGFKDPDDAVSAPWPLLLGAAGAAFVFWRRRRKRRKEKEQFRASKNLAE